MTVYSAINDLLDYGLSRKLFAEEDRVYCLNRILDVMGLEGFVNDFTQADSLGTDELEPILKALLDNACERGLLDDSTLYRDLFDTRLMDCMMPRPSEVIERFKRHYDCSPECATNFYYSLAKSSDYVRTYRIKKDIKWLTPTDYGDIDITINLSKPEKDPRAIKLAGMKKGGDKYPLCLLCRENEGYAGRADHPARNSHRLIPITVDNEKWFMQYSPYSYYNEHCIFLNSRHVPMVINRSAFKKLLDIVTVFPHYFVGSNADLPIVGGSILAHEHFQGGRYDFAMAKAPVEREIDFPRFPGVKAGIVKWPMSVIRLDGADPDEVCDAADFILSKWKEYSDEEAGVTAYSDGERHNTITPIARRAGAERELYELDLVLRCNVTSEEFPDGVFHAHPEYHHIKRENIGLIEVMGLAVLPSRLIGEMSALANAMTRGVDLRADETLAKHADWAERIAAENPGLSSENAAEILNNEIGKVFCAILENCGVFKRDAKGMEAFMRFASELA